MTLISWVTFNRVTPRFRRIKFMRKSIGSPKPIGGGNIRYNTISRKVYNRQGEEIDDEYVTDNHAIMMDDPFLERPET